ncbi:MAG: alpha-1,2-fucosyltransferase [bacterium]
MVIIKLKGGIGNQLFQYAFGRLFSITNKTEVKYYFPEVEGKDTQREYELGSFNCHIDLASTKDLEDSPFNRKPLCKIYRKIKDKLLGHHHIGYDKKSLATKEKYLEGFWQSYKYLEPIKEILFKEITPKEPIEEKYSELMELISQSNSVSLHIRRGDYVNDPKTKKHHLVFGLEYYADALKVISEKIPDPKVFVFSDDKEWAKKNLQVSLPTYYVSQPGMKDYEELLIMSKCKHNIIANSSFSFWGAWLNQNAGKIVIAPDKWNNKYDKEYRDLLPPDWIKISIR